jgi:hypothetical protein
MMMKKTRSPQRKFGNQETPHGSEQPREELMTPSKLSVSAYLSGSNLVTDSNNSMSRNNGSP